MWVVFDKIEFKSDLISNKGTQYNGFVVTGIKRGWKEPDSPYEKVFFQNTIVTVISGHESFEMDIIDFFNACKSDDLLSISSVKDPGSQHWRVSKVENKTRKVRPETSSEMERPVSANDFCDEAAIIAAASYVNTLALLGEYAEIIKDPDKTTESVDAFLNTEIDKYYWEFRGKISDAKEGNIGLNALQDVA